jgi:hypothetical protein
MLALDLQGELRVNTRACFGKEPMKNQTLFYTADAEYHHQAPWVVSTENGTCASNL